MASGQIRTEEMFFKSTFVKIMKKKKEVFSCHGVAVRKRGRREKDQKAMRGKNEEMPKSKRRKSKVRLIGSGSSAHLDAYKKRKNDRFTKVQRQYNVRRSDKEIDERKWEESEFVRKIAFKDTTEVCFSKNKEVE